MPSYLDLGLIVVVLTSALLSMVRGFTREVLAIVSWASAAIAALYLHPMLVPYLKPYIQKESLALWASAAVVFLVVLVVVTIVTVKVSDLILDSRVGALDRSLGFVFGAARGYLLAVIAFLFFSWMVQGREPEWVKSSKTRAYLTASGEYLKSMLPADPFTFMKGIKGGGGDNKGGGAPPEDTTPNDTGAEKPQAPAPAPSSN